MTFIRPDKAGVNRFFVVREKVRVILAISLRGRLNGLDVSHFCRNISKGRLRCSAAAKERTAVSLASILLSGLWRLFTEHRYDRHLFSLGPKG